MNCVGEFLLRTLLQRFQRNSIEVRFKYCRMHLALTADDRPVAELFATDSIALTMFFLACASESNFSNSCSANAANTAPDHV